MVYGFCLNMKSNFFGINAQECMDWVMDHWCSYPFGFEETTNLFSRVVEHFTFPPAVSERSRHSVSLLLVTSVHSLYKYLLINI